MITKLCMLEENRICDNCVECDICDIDPKKLCDNCAKCIDNEVAYRSIDIDEIIIAEDLKRKFRLIEQKFNNNSKKGS